MKPKDKTAAKRNSDLRDKYRSMGFVPVHVWVHPDDRKFIQDLAAESRRSIQYDLGSITKMMAAKK